MSHRAFSLVEVTMALGIMSFALISMLGLASVGLERLRENFERSVEVQIVDWVQSTAKAAYEEASQETKANGNPFNALSGEIFGFDRHGLHLKQKNDPELLYTATITANPKVLPGSVQSVWGLEVVIRSPVRGNRLIGTNAVWFSK